jgi:hypothetical protein
LAYRPFAASRDVQWQKQTFSSTPVAFIGTQALRGQQRRSVAEGDLFKHIAVFAHRESLIHPSA